MFNSVDFIVSFIVLFCGFYLCGVVYDDWFWVLRCFLWVVVYVYAICSLLVMLVGLLLWVEVVLGLNGWWACLCALMLAVYSVVCELLGIVVSCGFRDAVLVLYRLLLIVLVMVWFLFAVCCCLVWLLIVVCLLRLCCLRVCVYCGCWYLCFRRLVLVASAA